MARRKKRVVARRVRTSIQVIKPQKEGQKPLKFRKGGLHKSLGIPKNVPIPKTLVRRLLQAREGSVIKNPTKIGKPKIKVTKLIKSQVNLGFKGALAKGRKTAMRNRRRK